MDMIKWIELAKTIVFQENEEFRYMALLMACMIYIFCVEKTQVMKRILWLCCCVGILFFVPPLIKWAVPLFGETGYEKALLLIPANLVIAYTVVDIYAKTEGKKQKAVWCVFCTLMLLLSGKYAYAGSFTSGVFDNAYYIKEPYAEVQSLVPLADGNLILPCDIEIGQLLRRIDGRYKLLYGKNIENGSYSENVQKIYEDFGQEMIPLDDLLTRAEAEGVTHIILYKWGEYDVPLGNLAEEGRISVWAESPNYYVFVLNANQ